MSDTDLALAPDEIVQPDPQDAAPPDNGAEAPDPQPSSPVEDVAAAMGWSPQDKWRGNPDKWKPADEFLKATVDINKSLRDQVARTTRTAEKIIEQNRRQAIADAREAVKQAAIIGDQDAIDAATNQLEQASTQATQSTGRDDFAKRNPWILDNDEARGLALGAAQRVANRGGSEDDQFEAAEAAVRKRMPELFDDSEAAPLAPKPPKAPPSVQGGGRTAAPNNRPKGWGDIPQAIRSDAKGLISKGMCTEAEYAAEYWKENG